VIVDSLSSLTGRVFQRDTERRQELRYFLGLQKRVGRAIVMVSTTPTARAPCAAPAGAPMPWTW